MENYQRKSLFGFLQLCSILLYSVTRTDILGVRKAASHFYIMEYPCNCIFFIRLSFIFNPNLHLGHIYLFSLIIKQKYLHSCYFRPQGVKQEKLNTSIMKHIITFLVLVLPSLNLCMRTNSVLQLAQYTVLVTCKMHVIYYTSTQADLVFYCDSSTTFADHKSH